jgi:hypothetical protein
VAFEVDNVALEQVFSEYFCFPCHFSFLPLLHTHHHHHLSTAAGTIGQIVADVPSELNLTPPSIKKEEKKKKKKKKKKKLLTISVNPFAFHRLSKRSMKRGVFQQAVRVPLVDLK